MIGHKIKHYLNARGKSVAALADLWQVSTTQVYNIFNSDSIETSKLVAFSNWINEPIQNFFENINPTNHLTLHEPELSYHTGELEALRELVRTQRDLIELLKTASGAAKKTTKTTTS